MISEKSVQEILETAKVEEVVQEFVNLKRRGANLIGLCPFHTEKTPSFTVSPSKNIYKCFGCGEGGNAVQFLMQHEQMSFPEALRYLAVGQPSPLGLPLNLGVLAGLVVLGLYLGHRAVQGLES